MKDLKTVIESLRSLLERHRHKGLKEYPTRTIFIDPLLSALGWDIRDPEEVELEYPTVDGKSVDYAMKINRKAVLLLEAKQLNDSLDDVKAITQIVGYAANDGIEWCVLTNGIRYKVYKASEKAPAPDKLLFEVSIDPCDSEGLSIEQIATQLNRISKDSLAQGVLDNLGKEIFTSGKVRKALDYLFISDPQPIIRLVRKTLGDNSVTPTQIQKELVRIWHGSQFIGDAIATYPVALKEKQKKSILEFDESHHTDGKPSEVVELYRALDRICQDMAQGRVTRTYKALYISWSLEKAIFCCAHLQRNGLRVWVKTDPKKLDTSDTYARDVTNIGHWGVGNVELAIDSMERLQSARKFIKESFDREIEKRIEKNIT